MARIARTTRATRATRSNEDDQEEAPRSRRTRRNDNHITVKVARTGQPVTEVALNGSKMVEDALVAANVDFSARDRIRVNGDSASLDDELSQDDIVTISGKVQGGIRGVLDFLKKIF